MMGSSSSSSLLALISLFAPFLAMAQQQCYYPDGQVAKDYTFVVCNTTTSQSACCIPSEGDVCLSNNLCYWTSGNYPFRGACTDKNWASDACPKYCLDVDQKGWIELEVCGGGKFCCGGGCCNTGNPFSIPPAVVGNTFGKTGVIVPTAVLGAGPPSPSASSSPSASASATSAGGSKSTNSATASTVTLVSTSSASSNSSGSSTGKTIAIGVGVGVSVGLLFAAILAFFCYRLYGKKKPATAGPQPQQQAYVPVPPAPVQQQPYAPYPDQTYPAPQQQQQYPAYYPPQPHQQYPASSPTPAPPYTSGKDVKEAPVTTAPAVPAAIEMDATGLDQRTYK